MADSFPNIEIDFDRSTTQAAVGSKPPELPVSGAPQKADTTAAEKEADQHDEPSLLANAMSRSASWMLSLIVHMVLIIILALITLPGHPIVNNLITSIQGEEIDDELVELPEVEFEDLDVPIDPQEIDFQPDTAVIEEEVSFSPFQDELAAPQMVELADLGINSAPESLTTAIQGFDATGLTGRGHASRAALVRAGGGTAESEEAVALALAWLIAHQNPNGSWNLDHTAGKCQGRCRNPGELRSSTISATSLALLPFLGAGQTQFEGKYKNEVGRGLVALVRMGQRPDRGVGIAWTDDGSMYAHGISAIAMCEAYGMTQDSQLEAPAQAALNYIVSAQNPSDGGWRYSFQQAGDTSVVGWQVMALKSGDLATLKVPHSCVMGAQKFLDLAQNDEYGGAYGYLPDRTNYRASTSAVGLLCRMYMGWNKEHQGIIEGVERLAKRGPSKTDFYYNYYASQVLFQYTGGKGQMWEKWNTELRDFLVRSQVKEGHEKGSWYVRNTHASMRGGRLYMTAMACMTLEVYYRHMPIYRAEAVETDFPE